MNVNKQFAVVILYTTDNYLLLLNRAIAPLGFCLPGGGIDITQESLIQGAIREVREEVGVGLHPSHLELLRTDKAADGRDVHVFRSKAKITLAHIRLSREHKGYVLVDEKSDLDVIQLAGNTAQFIKDEPLHPRLHLETVIDFGIYKKRPKTLAEIMKLNLGYATFLKDHGFKFGPAAREAILTAEQNERDKDRRQYTSSTPSSPSHHTPDDSFSYNGGADEDIDDRTEGW